MCISGELWHREPCIKGERWVGNIMRSTACLKRLPKPPGQDPRGTCGSMTLMQGIISDSSLNSPSCRSLLWLMAQLHPAAAYLTLPRPSERPCVGMDVWCVASIWPLVIVSAFRVLFNLLLMPIPAPYPPPCISLALYLATQPLPYNHAQNFK